MKRDKQEGDKPGEEQGAKWRDCNRESGDGVNYPEKEAGVDRDTAGRRDVDGGGTEGISKQTGRCGG